LMLLVAAHLHGAATNADFQVYGLHSPFLAFGVEKWIPEAQPGLVDLKIDINTGHVVVSFMGAPLAFKKVQCAVWQAGYLAGDEVTITTQGIVSSDAKTIILTTLNGTGAWPLGSVQDVSKLAPEMQQIMKNLIATQKPAELTALFAYDAKRDTYRIKRIINLNFYNPPVCCPCSKGP
ncbi:MAG TPA: hypothetical protein VLG71_01550, partial [Candidatus Limnocylindria bacterium]|nr:hypothetical protein [Candidatus Limnocylindria bacterium]